MRQTIEETARRRAQQMAYNEENGITPTPLQKSKEKILKSTKVADGDPATRVQKETYSMDESTSMASEPLPVYTDPEELEKAIAAKRKEMEKAAKALDFIAAAKFRDELFELQARKV